MTIQTWVDEKNVRVEVHGGNVLPEYQVLLITRAEGQSMLKQLAAQGFKLEE